MLIEVSPPICIIPNEFPQRLVLVVHTKGRSSFGVFDDDHGNQRLEVLEGQRENHEFFELPLENRHHNMRHFRAVRSYSDVFVRDIALHTRIDVVKVDDRWHVSICALEGQALSIRM